MPFKPFVPPPSNTPINVPQNEAQDRLGPHRGGLSTFMFIIVLGVVATVIYGVVL